MCQCDVKKTCENDGKLKDCTCTCTDDWTGDTCETPKDVPCPDDCSDDHGKCKDGICTCKEDWKGITLV